MRSIGVGIKHAMPTGISKQTIRRARELRKNMGEAEAKLWQELRELKLHGTHVRKQVPIGKYIADFAILKRKLVIEVGGHQHYEPAAVKYDQERTRWLEAEGYRVIRFSTADVTDALDGCVE